MTGIKAITVCVNYDDLLRLALPRIVKHVDTLLIVTSFTDLRTHALAAEYPDKVQLHMTDAFYRNGASFNKGLAMEEGFDVLGRTGWILILDADIVLPPVIPKLDLVIGKMYTPGRHILSNVDGMTPEGVEWLSPQDLPFRHENGNFGYFQLFHADDPVIRERPWYGTDWVHAGGCDSVFEKRWAKADRLRMPFVVIHLGDPDQNWFGRSTARIDTQEKDPDADARLAKQNALHRKYGWKGHRKTGEAVVERLASNPAVPEVCHDHDNSHQTMLKKRKGGKKKRHVKPPTIPAPTPPPVTQETPKVPSLRPLPPPTPPRIRGMKP